MQSVTCKPYMLNVVMLSVVAPLAVADSSTLVENLLVKLKAYPKEFGSLSKLLPCWHHKVKRSSLSNSAEKKFCSLISCVFSAKEAGPIQ